MVYSEFVFVASAATDQAASSGLIGEATNSWLFLSTSLHQE